MILLAMSLPSCKKSQNTISSNLDTSETPSMSISDESGSDYIDNSTNNSEQFSNSIESTKISSVSKSTTSQSSSVKSSSATSVAPTAQIEGNISKKDTTVEPVRSLKEINAMLSLSDYECNTYNLEKYLLPYWKGNIVYNEPLNFIKDKTTGEAMAPLLFTPLKILSVKDSTLKITYTEGQDYTIVDGKIKLTANTRIHCFNYSDMFFAAEKTGSSWALKNGGYTYFAEGTYFHSKQVAVTYLHSNPWTGYKPAYQGENLPNIISKLKSGKDVKIVFYGDSITKGGNASGMFGVDPKTPIWADMTVEMLKKAYPNAKISSYNPAVNGSNSAEGLRDCKVSVSDQKPDLVIIGYGMNDGADSAITPAVFKSNISAIMTIVNKLYDKSCEYILISSTLPNQEIKLGNANMQDQYAKVLFELERKGTLNGTGGAVVADMTAINKELLKTKRFFDMTANNVNHPNDFLVRAHAQVICTMLIEKFMS